MLFSSYHGLEGRGSPRGGNGVEPQQTPRRVRLSSRWQAYHDQDQTIAVVASDAQIHLAGLEVRNPDGVQV